MTRWQIFLVVMQALSVVDLAVVGIIPFTRGRNGLTSLGWILVVAGAIVFISVTVIREIDTIKTQAAFKDELFKEMAKVVMGARRELSPAPAPMPSQEIQITAPRHGTEVEAREFIEGVVSDPNVNVWVIVQPMVTGAYWVQPAVSVRRDGAWKTQAYFGRSGDIDRGKRFQIMAVADSRGALREGEVLDRWPDAQWKSEVVEVIRK